jgi:AraC-like DNA-binding protein
MSLAIAPAEKSQPSHGPVLPAETAGADAAVWPRLVNAPQVREQQVAFTCATGLPLTLLPPSARADDGPFAGAYCVKGCLGEPSGGLCRRTLLRAEARAVRHVAPVQYSCPSGLLKILVPVFVEGRHVANLLAGPFTLRALNRRRLAELMTRLSGAGLGDRQPELETTWRYTPRLSAEKGRAVATLLSMFARYLEGLGRELLAARPAPARAPLLEKIEAFLRENADRRVALREVAARVHLSPCHFCAVFKRQTGLTFTAYRNRLRLDRAAELLREPGRRITDVAFEAGFDSIPYFNRAFRRRFGCSPTEYRRRLGAEIAVKPVEMAA